MQQTQQLRGAGIEDLGGCEPAPRLARTDRCNHIRRNDRRQQAELALGQAEARLGTTDGDIATRHQADTTAEGGPVDARDGGLGQFIQGAHQLRQRQCVGGVLRFVGAGHAAHPVQVCAGRKGRAITGQHDDADLRGPASLAQCIGQRGDQRRIEGVVDCGAMQSQGADRSVVFDNQAGVLHCVRP